MAVGFHLRYFNTEEYLELLSNCNDCLADSGSINRNQTKTIEISTDTNNPNAPKALLSLEITTNTGKDISYSYDTINHSIRIPVFFNNPDKIDTGQDEIVITDAIYAIADVNKDGIVDVIVDAVGIKGAYVLFGNGEIIVPAPGTTPQPN